MKFATKENRFISKLQKVDVMLLVTLTFFIAVMFCGMSQAADSRLESIIGTWRLDRDDDRPKGPVPNETMVFESNGKLFISGDHPNEARYRINGNQLKLQIMLGERAVTVERQFELSSQELKFRNEKRGWVYYRRVTASP